MSWKSVSAMVFTSSILTCCVIGYRVDCSTFKIDFNISTTKKICFHFYSQLDHAYPQHTFTVEQEQYNP
jgi:hypothetical protein